LFIFVFVTVPVAAVAVAAIVVTLNNAGGLNLNFFGGRREAEMRHSVPFCYI
jgi:hypothetical protein